MNLFENWVTIEPILLRDREILFLTLQAAGISIYPFTRSNGNIERYSHLLFQDGVLCGQTGEYLETLYNEYQKVTYSQVLSAAQDLIKSQINERELDISSAINNRANE